MLVRQMLEPQSHSPAPSGPRKNKAPSRIFGRILSGGLGSSGLSVGMDKGGGDSGDVFVC